MLRLLHHLHEQCAGPRQDEVADAAVVQVQNVQPVDRDHKLAHLEPGGEVQGEELKQPEPQSVMTGKAPLCTNI